MSVSTLQYWLRRAHSGTAENPRRSRSPVAPAAISLLEVELAGPAPCSVRREGGYEIEFRGGLCLRLPENFGDGEVRRLLSLLKEVR